MFVQTNFRHGGEVVPSVRGAIRRRRGGFETLRNNVTLDVLARKVRRKMRMFPACVTQYKYKYKCQFKIYL